ncbi:MAG TPA: hypothetical protein VJ852_00810 [Gemmatimonadaceae bacterium]|nr:hypothetical protein [Gemmatimonadaceae bacterium]
MKRRRFRVRNLLLSWTAYWLALIVVGLFPAGLAIWRMSQLPHGQGSVNASVNDGVVTANVLQNGATTWTGSISLLGLALLIALPPLVMWAVSLVVSARTINAGDTELSDGPDVAQLTPGVPDRFSTSASTSKRTSREGS